jgi:hypothetical protein
MSWVRSGQAMNNMAGALDVSQRKYQNCIPELARYGHRL